MRRLVVLLVALLAACALPAGSASAAPSVVPAPTGLAVQVTGPHTVRLTWNAVKDATRYEIFWGDDSTYPFQVATSTTAAWSNEDGSVSFSSAGPAVFGVRVVTRKGTSELSSLVRVLMPPESPGNPDVEIVQPNLVRLSWGTVQGATEYVVSQVAPDGTETPADTTETGSPTSVLVAVVADTTYTFRVRAKANDLLSPGYGEVSVTTPPRRETQTYYDAKANPVTTAPTTLSFRVVAVDYGGGSPSGSVSVTLDDRDLGTKTLDPQLGGVDFDVDLDPGPHTYAVRYAGDTGYLASSASGSFEAADPAPRYRLETLDSAPLAAATVADVTCDGRADLVSLVNATGDGTTAYTTQITTRPTTEDGTLQAARSVSAPTTWNPQAVAVGDLDGDGCGDVVAAAGDLLVASGSSAGPRTPTKVRGVTQAWAVTVVDMNADKVTDLLVTTSSGLLLLPGNGRGSFGKARTLLPGSPGRVADADLDGDARRDLLVLDGEGTVTAYRQSATGTFGATWSTNVVGAQTLSVADVDGDGLSDAVVSGEPTTILSGADGSATVPALTYGYSRLAVGGDLDSDGDADVLAVDGTYGRMSVSVTSDDTITAWQEVTTDPWVYSIGQSGLVIGDLGSDGSTEVVALDYDQTTVMRRVTT